MQVSTCIPPEDVNITPRMSYRRPPETPEVYYAPVTQDLNYLDNRNARRVYFEETEPKEGRPKDTKIMHVIAAKTIAQSFLNKISIDLMVNSQHEWSLGSGSPIPDPDLEWPWGGPKQPLAQGQFMTRPPLVEM